MLVDEVGQAIKPVIVGILDVLPVLEAQFCPCRRVFEAAFEHRKRNWCREKKILSEPVHHRCTCYIRQSLNYHIWTNLWVLTPKISMGYGFLRSYGLCPPTELVT